MALNYLEFDVTEDGEGHGSFDALASVPLARWPALQAEVVTVLRWAHEAFGTPGALDDGAQWDCELQGALEVATPLAVRYDAAAGQLSAQPAGAEAARRTLSLTLSGSAAFCEALRQAFDIAP